jgi:hypothetical protein
MAIGKKEMRQQLKFEIEKGRYYHSPREARHALEIFRDRITCLNVGLREKEHASASCFLSELPARSMTSRIKGSAGRPLMNARQNCMFTALKPKSFSAV